MFSYNEVTKHLSVDKLPHLIGIPFEYIKTLIQDSEEHDFRSEDIDYIDEIDDLGYVDDITYDIYSYNLSADNLLRILSIQVPNCSPADWYEYGVDLEELMVLIDFAKNNLDIDSSNYPLLEVDNIYELESKLKGMLDMAVFDHKSNNLASLEL